ncbi:MAG: oligosaccharide flippase family protein [Thermoplasmata archaeon]
MAAESGADLREGLSTVTRGTIFVIVSTLCLVLFNFLSRVVLVKQIGNAGWGEFSTGLALAGILASVGTLGLPNAVARSLPYATSDAERRTIVRVSFWVSAASAALLAALLWANAQRVANALGNSGIAIGFQFFSIAIGASIVGALIASIFQGYSDVTPNALFLQVVNPGLFLAFLEIALVLPGGGLTYTRSLVAYALANAVTLASLAAYAARRLPHHLPAGPLAPEATGRLLRFATPLLVAGAMASLASFGDTLVLGVYHNLDVGRYTASLTLARLLPIGISAASYIYLPVAARFIRRENHRAVRLTYATVTKWMVLLSMPLFFLFFLLPERSLGFVYTTASSGVALPLQLAVAGAFAATLLGPAATTQIAYGRVRLLAYNSAAAGIADVAIAFALVPTYGSVGASVAWGTANLLYAALCLAELAALDGVHPFRRDFLLPLLVTLVPLSLLLVPFRGLVPVWALPPMGLAVAGAYILAVMATGSLNEGDALLLGAIERLIGRPLPFVHRLARWSRRRNGSD